jgi:hypothetical protein
MVTLAEHFIDGENFGRADGLLPLPTSLSPSPLARHSPLMMTTLAGGWLSPRAAQLTSAASPSLKMRRRGDTCISTRSGAPEEVQKKPVKDTCKRHL